MLEQRRVTFEFDGEMSADVALNRTAMELYPFCRLSGPANVLVMPAFHSASISTRMLQELGGSTLLDLSVIAAGGLEDQDIKGGRMLWGLFVMLACQLAGEAVSYLSGLPLPGPVIGMLILVALLCLRDSVPSAAERTVRESVGNSADLLLRNLSLLFIPAGVGVIQRYDLVAKHGVGLALTVVLSTILTLTVTATVFTLAARSTAGQSRETPDE